jgi:5-methylcytosine-specific restriction endonuclease McrA
MLSSRRDISKGTRAFVLDRDRLTCQMCGAVSGEPHHEDSRQKAQIQVGRIVAQSLGGSNDAGNLRAICSICNQGLRNLTLDRPSLQKLLIQIRRATGGDQLEVLKWLSAKYPVQAAKFGGKVEK